MIKTPTYSPGHKLIKSPHDYCSGGPVKLADGGQPDDDLKTAVNNPGNPGLSKQVDIDNDRIWNQGVMGAFYGTANSAKEAQKDSDAKSSPNHRLPVKTTAPGTVVPKLPKPKDES